MKRISLVEVTTVASKAFDDAEEHFGSKERALGELAHEIDTGNTRGHFSGVFDFLRNSGAPEKDAAFRGRRILEILFDRELSGLAGQPEAEVIGVGEEVLFVMRDAA